ncbi:MAG: acyl--CoA ligase [Emcibacter sp.]|nr:acyl--CoA ligase [Emcibacter sp.]
MNQERVDNLPFLNRITDYVDYYAEVSPANEAVVCGDIRWNYKDLQQEVDMLAKALLASGTGKGDRVATLSPPNHHFWSLFLASASIGAIWLGLNPKYKLEEYLYVISDAKPKVVFAYDVIGERVFSHELHEILGQNREISRLVLLDDNRENSDFETLPDFKDLAVQISDEQLADAREKVEAKDSALIVYTSGSTGKPKGALLPHRGLVRCSRNQVGHYDVSPVRLENFFPINHVACVGDVSCFCLVAGGTIFFMENFDPEASLAQIAKEKITMWGGIPTTLQFCMGLENFRDYDLSSIQLIGWGGAAASEDLIGQLLKISPRLTSCYGLTETVGSVTFIDPTADVGVLKDSIGKPVPEYEVRLIDSSGNDVEDGAQGEILVRGDFIMTEYWNRPKETSEAIDKAGWFHTGDLALKLSDGNLKLLGRMGEMFKSGGYNIYPREIEQALEACADVEMAAVFGVSDELYGEIGIAYVQPSPEINVQVNDIVEHCKGLLANYKIPKHIIIEKTLPLLPVGKIDKARLKAKFLLNGVKK